MEQMDFTVTAAVGEEKFCILTNMCICIYIYMCICVQYVCVCAPL